MIKYRHYHCGSLYGIRYDFERGDKLPMHAHESDMEHNVIVLSGFVEVNFAQGLVVSVPLCAGSVYDFDNRKRHEIVASQGPASILNMFVNGRPDIYKELPESELSGVIL